MKKNQKVQKDGKLPMIPWKTGELCIFEDYCRGEWDKGKALCNVAQLILRYSEQEPIYWIEKPLLSAFSKSSPVDVHAMPFEIFYVPLCMEDFTDWLVASETPKGKLILQGFIFARSEILNGFELLLSWGIEGTNSKAVLSDATDHWIPLDLQGEVMWDYFSQGDQALSDQLRYEANSNTKVMGELHFSSDAAFPLSGDGADLALSSFGVRRLADFCYRIASNLCNWMLSENEKDSETTQPFGDLSSVVEESRRLFASAKRQKQAVIAERHAKAAMLKQGYTLVRVGKKASQRIEERERLVAQNEVAEGITVRHWVAGHGKWQRFGQKLEQRRWIYVAPYLRGGKEGDPVTPQIRKCLSSK